MASTVIVYLPCWALSMVDTVTFTFGCKDEVYISLRDSNPSLLAKVLKQVNNVCWAVSLTRQLEAWLKRYCRLDYNTDLSIQEIIDQLPMNFRGEKGGLKKISHTIPIITQMGTVLEEEHKLSWVVDELAKPLPKAKRFRCISMTVYRASKYGRDRFEKHLTSLIQRSPVTVKIPVSPSLLSLKGREIYKPTKAELSAAAAEKLGAHLLLATGFGVDYAGQAFLECQNSWGKERHDNGYIRIALGCDLITFFTDLREGEIFNLLTW